ncbi:ribonuclease HII [Clostridium sp.]|uniref:ribonuclease HII n=1 Tax=Clostridium sp. TaxID=1506 RepID=UPI0026364A8B|nr:ribonuclease HII [Clostridium sp.]
MDYIQDIEKLSYKKVKEIIDDIDYENDFNNASFQKLVEKLKADKRKNIISLGDKMLREKEKLEKEMQRIKNMYSFDKAFSKSHLIAGVDEVGRGPLAGPIVACAVILDLNVLDDEIILGLNDSKKVPQKKRKELAEIIKKKAIAYFISEKSNKDIDEKGIAYCNNQIFLDSCYNLKVKPDLILSDGYLIKGIKIPNKYVIKGDSKSASIAAASILAKVYRDDLMKEYAKKYPDYNFEDNVGYGTKKHIEGISKVGICDIHRKSFLNNILNNL